MNQSIQNQKVKTLAMVQTALLAAIIIVMAFTPLGFIPLGFMNLTIIHIPVIIGSVLLGPKIGATLGFTFGLSSLIINTTRGGLLAFLFSPFYSAGDISGGWQSLIICFVPRILVGVVPYFVYKSLQKLFKGKKIGGYVSSVIAGASGALVNTVLVLGMAYLLYKEQFAMAQKIETSAVASVILGIVAANGIPEAIAAALVTLGVMKIPALKRIVKGQ